MHIHVYEYIYIYTCVYIYIYTYAYTCEQIHFEGHALMSSLSVRPAPASETEPPAGSRCNSRELPSIFLVDPEDMDLFMGFTRGHNKIPMYMYTPIYIYIYICMYMESYANAPYSLLSLMLAIDPTDIQSLAKSETGSDSF